MIYAIHMPERDICSKIYAIQMSGPNIDLLNICQEGTCWDVYLTLIPTCICQYTKIIVLCNAWCCVGNKNSHTYLRPKSCAIK